MNITTNRKARHDYFILDSLEVGIILQGTEIKALRAKGASLDGSYATVDNGEVWLNDCHIQEYTHGNVFNHKPKRRRKLLLRKREIGKVIGHAKIKGHSLVPLRLYFKRGLVKVELGICKGKQMHDKRQAIKLREATREIKND